MRTRALLLCCGVIVMNVWTFVAARADEGTGSERTNLQEEYDKEIRSRAEDGALLVIMDPVVVTATRAPKQLTQVPGAVSVIDQTQILQGRSAVGVDETLRIVPGVQTERRFGPDDQDGS